MATFDLATEVRLRGIEERLTRVEDRLGDLASKADVADITKQLAVISARLDEMGKRIPSVWLIVGLILPLYGVLIFGLAAMFYFLNTRLPGGSS